ncbi:hypothetical protein RUM43_000999 [Polyplax serrata]|uniref:HMG box domain-containing protein n=1 Tax=Polyplax serrata TaxID=468196 RepID=A0AAN8SDA4_POLSC
MGPKKQPKNAFYFFLCDYTESQRKKGRNISLKIGAEECGPMWQELSEDEKQKYSKMALAEKNKMKGDFSEKFTSTGESFDQVRKREQLLQNKLQSCDKEISTTIENMDQNKLPTYLFYLIHCNYYCKTDSDFYVPGELALCEFNLKDGIKRTYHVLINPGKIPLGFAFEAQQNIKDIHGLPYPPYPEGNSNYSSIVNDILNFLNPGRLPNGQIPPVYCLQNNINATESILQNLSGEMGDSLFRVYPLHKLLFTLKNKCVENKHSIEEVLGFPVLTNAILEIEKDVFCYVPGISCDFHINIEEKYQNCSLSIVQRFVYVICDHCCQELDIAIIPGKHSRLNCDTNRKKTVEKINNELGNKHGTMEVLEKSEVSGLCSYFGGSNVPEWTKVTCSSFFDNELSRLGSRGENEATYASVSMGRGRGLANLDNNNYDWNFPALSRGRGQIKK